MDATDLFDHYEDSFDERQVVLLFFCFNLEITEGCCSEPKAVKNLYLQEKL